jgi:hypothetical protein
MGNQWYLNGTIIPGAIQQSYAPLTAGLYSVRVTLEGCTSAFSNSVNFVFTSVISPELETKLLIAPNPVQDKLYIRSKEGLKLVVSIFDATGKQVVLQRFNTSTEVSMSEMAAGIYLVRIHNERTGESMTRKVVKN